MRELHLFAGAGGGILGGILLGHTCVCAVEIEPYCQEVLLQRQRDGILPRFPIWGDVRTFDGNPWRGRVDIIHAGIPCQRVSSAGKGGGFIDQDYYQSFKRIVREVEPSTVFVENSPLLLRRGFRDLLWDLAEMGFNGQWGVLGAREAAGLAHRRHRFWGVFTHPERSQWREESHDGQDRRMGRQLQPIAWDRAWLSVFAGVRRDGDGMANRLDRTDAIRNGQVPIVAATAFQILSQ